MKGTGKTLAAFMAAALLVAAAGTARASAIDWGDVFDIDRSFGADDLVAGGHIVWARDIAGPEDVYVTNSRETIRFTGDRTTMPRYAAHGDYGNPTGNDDLDLILDSHGWIKSPPQFHQITLEGLVAHNQYYVQFIAGADTRSSSRDRTQTVEDDQLPPHVSGPMRRGGVGSVIGTFTAEDTTETITLRAETDPALSMILVREVPEPSTVVLLGVGLLALGFWRRRRSARVHRATVMAAGLFVAAGGVVQASEIDWGEVFNISQTSGADDLVAGGEIVWARNIGQASPAGDRSVSNSIETISFIGDRTTMPKNNMMDFYGKPTGNADLDWILDSHGWKGQGTPETHEIMFWGLTAGHNYYVQFIAAADTRPGPGIRTQTVQDNQVPPNVSGPMLRSGVGSVVGKFTAEAPTETITLVGEKDPALSLILVREVPEPSTVVLLGVGLLALGFWRWRRRGSS